MQLVVLWAWAAVLWVAKGGDVMPWRHVLVESSWFEETVVQTTMNLSLISCGTTCMRRDWCRLWCHDELRGCLLASLTVSGSYQPSQLNATLSCYTSRQPELAARASITSSSHRRCDVRFRHNLVDGIYSGHSLNTASVIGDSEVFAWFLVDLGVSLPVSEVVLMAESRKRSERHFRDIEVRVGNVKMSGDFKSYSLLGTFMGPAESGKMVVLRSSTSLIGSYVSIQKTVEGVLQIAHLEIR